MTRGLGTGDRGLGREAHAGDETSSPPLRYPRGANRARALTLVLLAACGGPTDAQLPAQGGKSTAAPDVRVEVNAAAGHQIMEGFGSTTVPLIYQNGADDKLPAGLRTKALQAAYRDVRLTLGNVEIGLLEP